MAYSKVDKILTEYTKEQLIDLYKKYGTFERLAEFLECSKWTVQHTLFKHRLGIDSSSGWTRFDTPWNKGQTKETNEQVKQLALNQSLFHPITQKYSCEEFVNLYVTHKCKASKVAEFLGCSVDVIWKVFEEYNMDAHSIRNLCFEQGVIQGDRLGTTRSLSDRQKQSVTRKERIHSGVIDLKSNQEAAVKAWTGQHHTEQTKAKIVDNLLRRGGRITKIEQKLIDTLTISNIHFKFQHPVYDPVTTVADFFVQPNILIYADGCFVHACTTHYPKLQDPEYYKQKRVFQNVAVRAQKEPEKNRQLEKAGYTVLRFWEHEINTDIQSCISRIEQAIANSKR